VAASPLPPQVKSPFSQTIIAALRHAARHQRSPGSILFPDVRPAVSTRSAGCRATRCPGKPTKTLPPSTKGTLPPRSSADVEFMQGMIMHHQQAVEMTALIPSHTENKNLRSLGARISSSQSDEIRFMQRWLAARGEPISMAMPGMPDMDKSGHSMALMPGMLTPEQMDALRKSKGPEFDHLFLTGMIQHHNGALIMVKDLFRHRRRGTGCRPLQLRHRCRQYPARRNQNYADHVGE